MSDGGKRIALEGMRLTKTYGSGETTVQALKDVNFRIYKGELTVILGSSGSGKSTFLNMIGGMDRPDSGKILDESGNDICQFTKKEQTKYRKNHVGFVFQFYNLISDLTAYENIALSADMAKQAKAPEEVMEQLGILHKKDCYPFQLSGGEQQRVSIARALVKNAELLVCDEPTGALDAQTGRELFLVIEKLVRSYGQTVVVVTHNAVVAQVADRVLYLKNGSFVKEEIHVPPLAVSQAEW